MARTPLLNLIQSLYRDFAEAEASGQTVDAVQAARIKNKTSRREFLALTGLAVTTAALPAWAGPSPEVPLPRIAIVGGGIAGLNAALTLQDAGIPSTIYEASGRFGGRMHSDTTTWQNGQVTEHCGELIDSTHKTILGLARRFKIQTVDLVGAEPSHSTETYYFFGERYPLAQATADFKPVYLAVKNDLSDAGYPTLYNSYSQAAAALDQISIYEWIESRVPHGHSSSMGQLVDVAFNIEYGAETTAQSSLNLIYLLGSQGVFGRSDERYHLAGGNEGLPRAIAGALPKNSIQLNKQLNSIARNGDGTYTLILKNAGKSSTVVADRVILTLPFSVLRNLDYGSAGFNAIKNTAIQELGYGTNAKLHTQFNNRMWNQIGPWGISNGSSFADTGYQNTWDVTRGQSGDTGILVDYTGGNVGASFTGDLGNANVIRNYAEKFLGQLEPVFPGIRAQWNSLATLDVPARSPYLLGSYSYWKRAQYTRFAGAERERSGNCHFAGEHCSINFQGFMEGGAAEGARAANEILSDYKAGILP